MSGKIYFPDISSPTWPFKEAYEDTSISSKFEDGSMQTRTKFTRSRRSWKLKWNNISREEYLTLMNFIVNTVKFSAKTFWWINPDTLSDDNQEEINVRVTTIGDWKNENMDYWTGELELTEV